MNTLLYSNRVNIPYSVKTNQEPIPLGYNKMMTNIFYRPSNRPNIPVVNNPVVQEEVSTNKVMVWGEPTWFLLHTLSYKVKEDIFLQFKI